MSIKLRVAHRDVVDGIVATYGERHIDPWTNQVQEPVSGKLKITKVRFGEGEGQRLSGVLLDDEGRELTHFYSVEVEVDETVGMSRTQLYDYHLQRMHEALSSQGVAKDGIFGAMWQLFALLRPDDIAAATNAQIAGGIISGTLHALNAALSGTVARSPVQVPDEGEPPVEQVPGHGG